jgi:hypothetical protein
LLMAKTSCSLALPSDRNGSTTQPQTIPGRPDTPNSMFHLDRRRMRRVRRAFSVHFFSALPGVPPQNTAKKNISDFTRRTRRTRRRTIFRMGPSVDGSRKGGMQREISRRRSFAGFTRTTGGCPKETLRKLR